MILNAARRQAAADLRRRRQRARLLHVEDHCAGILQALGRGPSAKSINIGGGNERTNLEIVDRICRRDGGLVPARSTVRSRCPAITSSTVCVRSSRPRPALRDRRDQDPPRARMGAAAHVRAGLRRDRAVVQSRTSTGARRCSRGATTDRGWAWMRPRKPRNL